MYNLKFNQGNDDPSIDFNTLVGEQTVPIKCWIRCFDSTTSKYKDLQIIENTCNMEYLATILSCKVEQLTEDMFHEYIIGYIRDYISKSDGFFNSTGRTEDIRWLLPYAPPSIEYYDSERGLMVGVFFYHDKKTYDALERDRKDIITSPSDSFKMSNFINKWNHILEKIYPLYKSYYMEAPWLTWLTWNKSKSKVLPSISEIDDSIMELVD